MAIRFAAPQPQPVVHAVKPVVHAAVVHAKRKPGVYADVDRRRAYKAAHERQRRAAAKAAGLNATPLRDSGRSKAESVHKA